MQLLLSFQLHGDVSDDDEGDCGDDDDCYGDDVGLNDDGEG